jgi:hypothetical protein
MFTNGSRLFLGATALTAVGFTVYGVTESWGALGSVTLFFLIGIFALLAGVSIWSRDANVSPTDEAAVHTSAAANPPPVRSIWPLVGAVGGVLLSIGLITDQRFFVAGIILLLVALGEWAVEAWAERASADAGFNSEVRGRTLGPLELPLAAAGGVAIVIFGFSRVMLAAQEKVGPVIFVVAAALVLVFGWLFASKPRLRRGLVVTICALGGLAVLTGGIASASKGQRADLTHDYEEDPYAARDGQRNCTADTNVADEDSSGRVADKASVSATFTLTADGALDLRQLGGALPEATELLVDKGNPVTFLFKNDMPGEKRRLRVFAGKFPHVDQNGSIVPDTFDSVEYCTQAIAEGDTAFLALTFDKPSAASQEPFYADVPGVDGTKVEIVVP